MIGLPIQNRRKRNRFAEHTRGGISGAAQELRKERGSAILEFAITLPLLVVFVVGIYDFSGAFNQKQKIAQAAQEGAILAAAQAMNDIGASNTNPLSLQPVATATAKSLLDSGVLPAGTCSSAISGSGGPNLKWNYTISGCTGLLITIQRGWACSATSTPPCTPIPGQPVAIGTVVTVSYPYTWRFNSVIQLLIPGANYSLPPTVTESATVHNQT